MELLFTAGHLDLGLLINVSKWERGSVVFANVGGDGAGSQRDGFTHGSPHARGQRYQEVGVAKYLARGRVISWPAASWQVASHSSMFVDIDVHIHKRLERKIMGWMDHDGFSP